jgi:hypothetical protein
LFAGVTSPTKGVRITYRRTTDSPKDDGDHGYNPQSTDPAAYAEIVKG